MCEAAYHLPGPATIIWHSATAPFHANGNVAEDKRIDRHENGGHLKMTVISLNKTLCIILVIMLMLLFPLFPTLMHPCHDDNNVSWDSKS